MKKSIISLVMSEMGKKGGKIGGKRSLETMTPEERTARRKRLLLRRPRSGRRSGLRGVRDDEKRAHHFSKGCRPDFGC
jgi:hypothetical protein